MSFELGSLKDKYDFSNRTRGEASIHFGLCWRIESPRAIMFWSREDGVETDKAIVSLKGRRILDVQTVGRLPEIAVGLSGQRWIQTFQLGTGGPAWNIILPDRSSISSRSGKLVHYNA